MRNLFLVSIMIATRNRVAELRKTLAACLAQELAELEILVVDDASTDGTFDEVRRNFPDVHIVRRERNLGSIAARNDIVRRFVDASACRRIVQRMDAETDLGIVSFQPIGPEHPERMTAAGRLRGEWHCSSFAACGAAIRRSMLDQTGLFPEFYFHAYEEPDLCIRAWNAGYRVLQWNDIIVYHEYSGLNRNEQRTHRFQTRNEACSAWMRCPWHLVLPMTLARFISQARYAASRGWLLREPRIWAEFLWRLPRCLLHRQPVSVKAVKICLAVNRIKVKEAAAAWKLGDLGWRQILGGDFPRELLKDEASVSPPEALKEEASVC